MKDLIAQTTRGFLDGYRYIVHEGGTRSGKTHSILTSLYHITNSRPSITSVVSETFPHLRKGAIRDYKRILQSQKMWDEKLWNKTDSVHTIAEDRLLEFFSADNSDKVHGPERDFLFLNEAQNISYDIARHLFVRTKKTIFIDFNPTREFWAHEELKNDPRCLWVHSTYKDNPHLTSEQVEEIEKNKGKKQWWSIYGEGKVAESEGSIYKGWQQIDEIPHEARLERFGLDFGYTNDPTAIVAVYRYNGGFILDEITYQKGLSNKQIADILLNQESKALVIADSAEPKSIDEIRSYGVNIMPSTKGQGSVLQGIQFVQDQRISITKRSLNGIKEYRNYLWLVDKDGHVTNTPDVGFDHFNDACFTGDTQIETILGNKQILDISVGDLVKTSSGFRRVTHKHNNGMKLVSEYLLQLDTSSIKIKATKDHKVKTNKGWIKISKLKSGMTLYLSNHLTIGNISYTEEKNTFPAPIEECTGTFMSSITERYPKDFMHTIRTATHGITDLKILCWLKKINIYLNTVKDVLKKIQSGLSDFRRLVSKKLSFGTNHQRGLNGIDNMEKTLGRTELLIENLSVNSVGEFIKQDMRGSLSTAIKTVKLKHLDIGESWRENVYDLTVEEDHEYFANGILVHNCRYAITSMMAVEDHEDAPDDSSLFNEGFY